jgi:hypothetical protein
MSHQSSRHRYLRPQRDAKGKAVFSSDSKLAATADWNESKKLYCAGSNRNSRSALALRNHHHHLRRGLVEPLRPYRQPAFSAGGSAIASSADTWQAMYR